MPRFILIILLLIVIITGLSLVVETYNAAMCRAKADVLKEHYRLTTRGECLVEREPGKWSRP